MIIVKAAANGEFDYNGGTVEVKSTEVQARMAEGLGTLGYLFSSPDKPVISRSFVTRSFMSFFGIF